MKKILIILYKVLFWILFVWNLGIVQWTNSPSSEDKDNPYVQAVWVSPKAFSSVYGRAKVVTAMYQLYDKKVVRARYMANHAGYSPYDYFTDMKEINDYRIKNGVHESPLYGELQSYMQLGLQSGKFSYDDVTKAREIALPGVTAYDKKHAHDADINWNSAGAWLLSLYLKMLPFAIVLLLIWLYEAHGFIRFRSPLSFLLSVAMYPILISTTVILFWVGAFKQILGEVAIRRTKQNFLSMLSKDEVALVRRFAKSRMSYKTFCTALLANGKVQRYSFMVVLLVTIGLHCFSKASAFETGFIAERPVICSYMAQYDCLSKVIHSQVHYLEKDSIHIRSGEDEAPHTLWIKKPHYLYRVITVLSKGFLLAIEHIPLRVVNFQFLTKLTYFKRNINEKNNSYFAALCHSYNSCSEKRYAFYKRRIYVGSARNVAFG